MAPADVLRSVLMAALFSPATETAATVTTSTHVVTATLQTISGTVSTIAATVVATQSTTTVGASSTAAPTGTISSSGSGPLAIGLSSNDLDSITNNWGNGAFAALFGICTVVHIFQGCYHRLGYSAIVIVGGLAEFIAYVLRAAAAGGSHNSLERRQSLVLGSFILMQLAPLLITAFPYVTFYHLVGMRNIAPAAAAAAAPSGGSKGWPRPCRWLAGWYVWGLLAAAAATQAIACGLIVAFTGSDDGSSTSITDGIVTAAEKTFGVGLVLHTVFILVFMFAACQAYVTLPDSLSAPAARSNSTGDDRSYRRFLLRGRPVLIWLLWMTYFVLALLLMRVIFRMVVALSSDSGSTAAPADAIARRDTPSNGPSTNFPVSSSSSSTSNSEVYSLVLDGLPTLLALALLCVCHAGWALPEIEGSNRGPRAARQPPAENQNQNERSQQQGEPQPVVEVHPLQHFHLSHASMSYPPSHAALSVEPGRRGRWNEAHLTGGPGAAAPLPLLGTEERLGPGQQEHQDNYILFRYLNTPSRTYSSSSSDEADVGVGADVEDDADAPADLQRPAIPGGTTDITHRTCDEGDKDDRED